MAVDRFFQIIHIFEVSVNNFQLALDVLYLVVQNMIEILVAPIWEFYWPHEWRDHALDTLELMSLCFDNLLNGVEKYSLNLEGKGWAILRTLVTMCV